MTQDEIAEKLRKHRKWLNGEDGGEKADFHNADLYGADLYKTLLQYADLHNANLQYANLYLSDLEGANLEAANLQHSTLRWAKLNDVNLESSNLRYATLEHANLRNANLQYADFWLASLRNTNLDGADLWGARLLYSDLEGSNLQSTRIWPAYEICPEEGDFIAWGKGSDNCLIKLLIPESAERTSTIVSRKCRASEAKVLNIWDKDGNEIRKCYGSLDKTLEYTVGNMVYPDSYDPDPKLDYKLDNTNGIHFFITKKEAMNDW